MFTFFSESICTYSIYLSIEQLFTIKVNILSFCLISFRVNTLHLSNVLITFVPRLYHFLQNLDAEWKDKNRKAHWIRFWWYSRYRYTPLVHKYTNLYGGLKIQSSVHCIEKHVDELYRHVHKNTTLYMK